ncbi:class I SAM-dependent methyltransferase [uncultured Megasphaera sp.]|jgi:phospholipid N-methyltransferase|uniref:class I SAM-dependent methyltransferase n=1 Tax=uncultured Megasphaera sp. TaxID=165188 RepID=UPI0025DB2397|nr:hypothetical protein [uncultured Megasphaera sp.]
MKKIIDTERISFFKDFILNPSKIGSVTPSSSYLTQNLLGSLPWGRLHTIIELGAGTGVFTEFVIEHKRPDSIFLVIEQDARMRKNLTEKFPQALFGSQAENLPCLMWQYNLSKADCIISSLPFTVIEKQTRMNILTGIDTTLSDQGIFVAFQYSLQMYRTFHRIFPSVNIGFTLLNLPPAFTYTCHK